MNDILQIVDVVLKVSVVAFMVGNLLAIGLETDLKAALAPLSDVRFVLTATLLDWLLCPALAWLITRLLPIAQPYAIGLLAIGTVLLMPLAVPLIVPGLSVDPWTVAKPLLALLFLPMAAGIAVKTVAPSLAMRLLRIVRPVASVATILLLAAIGVRYFEGFVGAIGSFAIAAQLIYAVGLVLGGHALGAGLPAGRRSVLSLGACTRNLGAALAPLLVTPPDPRTMVMVALGVPITLGVTYLAAGWLSGRAGGGHR